MLQLLQCVCILLYFYIYICIKEIWYPSQTDRRVHQSRCQRPRSGDITHSVMWPANASTAHWLVSGQEVWVGWGWWGRGWFQASRCGVKPCSLLAGWKIFLLRNEAQVVWSVKIPKLKHCGGRSTEGWVFFVLFFWVWLVKWNGGEGFGEAGALEKVYRLLFFYIYLYMVRLFSICVQVWTGYCSLKVRKIERKPQEG